MPEIRYYEVEQTRTVKVRANNEVDAVTVATALFDDNVEEIWYPDGRVASAIGRIEVTQVYITRER